MNIYRFFCLFSFAIGWCYFSFIPIFRSLERENSWKDFQRTFAYHNVFWYIAIVFKDFLVHCFWSVAQIENGTQALDLVMSVIPSDNRERQRKKKIEMKEKRNVETERTNLQK